MQQFNQVILIMGLHIEDHKLLLTTEPKTFHFDKNVNLDQDVGNNSKHEIDSIKKHNRFLAGHRIKNKVIVQVEVWKRYS